MATLAEFRAALAAAAPDDVPVGLQPSQRACREWFLAFMERHGQRCRDEGEETPSAPGERDSGDSLFHFAAHAPALMRALWITWASAWSAGRNVSEEQAHARIRS